LWCRASSSPWAASRASNPCWPPKSDPWPRWEANDPTATATIAHDAWDRLLKRYVQPASDGINRFAYGQIVESDRRVIDAYVGGLADVAIGRHRRAEQRAYWINLYNALTVRDVLEHYPVATISAITTSRRAYFPSARGTASWSPSRARPRA
jgi:hypothetical protein